MFNLWFGLLQGMQQKRRMWRMPKVDGHPFGGTCIAAECIKRGGQEEFLKLKDTLISEFHALGIEGLEVKELHLLNGFL